jgi:uncharacterized membrane protein
MIEPILIVGIAIACTAWYMRHLWRRRLQKIAMQNLLKQHASGLELLSRRYAGGEINRNEYLQMREDILAHQVLTSG